jgi:hypothetical protein
MAFGPTTHACNLRSYLPNLLDVRVDDRSFRAIRREE